jgi:hypothetical protein
MRYRSLPENLDSLRSVAQALDPIGALNETAAARAALKRVLENHIAALEILRTAASEAERIENPPHSGVASRHRNGRGRLAYKAP